MLVTRGQSCSFMKWPAEVVVPYYSRSFVKLTLFFILLISGQGLCYGVSPIVTARVPVLKVIDRGTGVECDISVENKDGMSRSVIFKFISSIDERFRILCYLVL